MLLPTPRTKDVVRADLAAYYAVISHMDAQIGRILAAVDESGKADSTIIVFTSDHGLAMGCHGLRGKQNMYEHTIGVPLVLVGPGFPAGQRFQGQVYLRDLFPTLCELAGLPLPETDGISQAPVLTGERESMHDFVVGYFRDSQRMIRTARWKLIEYPLVDRVQLFDLKQDPFELKNLANVPAHQQTKQRLAQQLEDWFVKAARRSHVGR
jgi:arylsulfatase A-like enzyme